VVVDTGVESVGTRRPFSCAFTAVYAWCTCCEAIRKYSANRRKSCAHKRTSSRRAGDGVGGMAVVLCIRGSFRVVARLDQGLPRPVTRGPRFRDIRHGCARLNFGGSQDKVILLTVMESRITPLHSRDKYATSRLQSTGDCASNPPIAVTTHMH
jgi:hypothetical protein